MEPLKANDENLKPVAEIDRLIHEPSRYVVMAVLYVVESTDFLFLMRQTGFTGGNLSAHIRKLESAGYVSIEKEFLNNKPHTMVHLTEAGRLAFEQYRKYMKHAINTLPKIKSSESEDT
jgi:DNA-binding MarR family transcriptional regulator